MVEAKSTDTPFWWHFGAVIILFSVIYGYGIYDLFMMLGFNEAYYRSKGYDDRTVAYFTDYPITMLMIWVVNLLSGLATPILMMFRSRFAVRSALIAFSSIVVQQLITFGFMDRFKALGPYVSIFDIGIMLMTGTLFLYCKRMKDLNILK